MNHKKLSEEILQLVGKDNIKSVTHCYTRLRFSLLDTDKVDKEAVKRLEGVLDVVEKGGQFQIVIGQEVERVYKELNKLFSGNVEVEQQKKKITFKGCVNLALDVLISSFTPIIPVIAGCGMLKVLCALLINLGLISSESSTYQILAIFADSVYYFLPIFVGFTSAKRMNTDPFLGMVLGAILLHPNLLLLVKDGALYTSFLEFPVRIISYSAQALPVILSVWLMKYVNYYVDKFCPKLIKVFLRPMLTIIIVAPIMLIVIAPLGAVLGDYFQVFCDIMNRWGWIAVGLNAVIFPFLVLTGMHNALIPLIIQMFALQGFDAVLIPSGLVANIAEGGAAFGVFIKSKVKSMKGTALSATVSALFGITEPALYGVNLKLKRPFIAMLIGSMVGGCFAGLMKVIAYSFVAPSIISLPIFAGNNSSFFWAIVTAIFTFIFTAIITYIIGFKEENEETVATNNDDNSRSNLVENK